VELLSSELSFTVVINSQSLSEVSNKCVCLSHEMCSAGCWLQIQALIEDRRVKEEELETRRQRDEAKICTLTEKYV